MRTIALTVLSLTVIALSPVSAMKKDVDYRGKDPIGTVAYSLPSTTVVVKVEAERENFYAGPYARYASKYLGIDVRTADEVNYSILGIEITPYAEADLSRRFLLNLRGLQTNTSFLKLTASGLVSSAESVSGYSMEWRFPVIAPGDYSGKDMTSKLTTEATTLYKSVKSESNYSRVAMQQDMVVEKTEEERAAEAARVIFSLRKQRMSIITGDTDAIYSGSAMGSALDEITRLESEYLSLFTGYSEYGTQSCSFDLVPKSDRDSQIYIAFRFSETAGILPADDLSGRPVVLEITPENIAVPQAEKKVKKSEVPVVVYRIPATCSVRLIDGKNVLVKTRFPVYQLGEETTLPVNVNFMDREKKSVEKYYRDLTAF